MKIGFYSPYLKSLSGGERYLFTLASHWSIGHDVHIFWDNPGIIHEAASRFNINLSKVKTVSNIFKTRNIFKKMIVSRMYDLIFFLTDGSIPTTFAKHNILHFQVPFQHVSLHPIKMNRFQSIVCNSFFTKNEIEPMISSRALVIYPPVQSVKKENISKKRIILSVGRFHPLKKQDVLIQEFRKGNYKGFELILAGGLQQADNPYVAYLKKLGTGLAVKILVNSSYEDIRDLYNQSHVYWHAAGFGERNPELMEHFGITTVEAMSAGSVPIVFNGGGLSEIVEDGKNGFLWKNFGELHRKTKKLINSKALYNTISTDAVTRSHAFSVERFNKQFDALLTTIT